MVWGDQLFVHTVLPIGLRSAPKIFTAIADAVQWILQQLGVGLIIYYLDDFLVVVPPDHGVGKEVLQVTLQTFSHLGLPVAMDKLVGPLPCITFLGLETDSVAMKICLHCSKLVELQCLLWFWLSRARCSCTKRELESLLGKLCFVSEVVHFNVKAV